MCFLGYMDEVVIAIFLLGESKTLISHLLLVFLLQSDADYWLLSDADVSITDMWRTERILFLDLLFPLPSNMLHGKVLWLPFQIKYSHLELFGNSLIYLQLELNGTNWIDLMTIIACLRWPHRRPKPLLQTPVSCPLHLTPMGVEASTSDVMNLIKGKCYFLRTYDIQPQIPFASSTTLLL